MIGESVMQEQKEQEQQMTPALVRSITQGIRTGIGRIVSKFRPRRFPTYSDSLVEYVEKEFNRRKAERQGFELQWRLNLAFVEGKQYLDINVNKNDLTEVPRLSWWEQREVYNQIAPIVETRIARIGRMRPKLALRPASPDLSDASSTRIGMALVEHVERERVDADQEQDKLSWVEICGTVFEKNTWDPRLGKVIGYIQVQATDETPESQEMQDETPDEEDLLSSGALISQQIEQQLDPQSIDVAIEEAEDGALVGRTIVAITEGDVRVDVVPPFEIFPDSCYHPNIEDCRSIIHAKAYPKEEVWERWGIEVEAEADAESWGLQRQTVAGGQLGYGVGAFHTGTVKLKDHVVVKEYWERPSMMYPEGRLIVTAGKKLLYYSENLPFKVGVDMEPGLPFVKYVGIRKPGCFWGGCIVDRLLAPQRSYNALRNRKAEYLSRVAIGNLVMEEGSVQNPEVVEEDGGSPGFIFWVKRGFTPPRYLENEHLPSAFETEMATLLQEFTQISGVSETTRMSEAPPGVKSGVALNLVVEQDNTRLSHTVINLETGKVKSAQQWLRLYKQFATEPRLTTIAGKDASMVDAMYWSASDITSDDVVIQTSALLADTPAQRRQMVLELMQYGLFNDPDTGRITRAARSRIFELLQWGDWEFGNDLDDLQTKRAESENTRMLMGEMVVPEQYDNEELHIERHVRMLLTDRFQEADEKAQGMLKGIVYQHIQMHAQIQMMKQAALMQQQGGLQQ